MNKKILFVTIMCMLITLISFGCAKKNGGSYEQTDMAEMETTTEESKAEYEDGSANFAHSESTEGDYDNEFQDEKSESNVNNEKLIKTVNVRMETLDFNNLISNVESRVKKYNGYIEESTIMGRSINQKNEYNLRDAYYVIRVPAEKLDEFINQLGNIGNIISTNKTGKNVTQEYFDAEARVKTLKVREERLLEILKKATVLKDLIELEKALADVRYEIESLTTTLRKLDNLVSYSTIELNINEVVESSTIKIPAKTYGSKIKNTFLDSILSVKHFFQTCLLIIIAIIPFLVLIIIPLLVVLFIVKKLINKNKTKNGKNV